MRPGAVPDPGPDGEHELIGNLRDSLKTINPRNLQECYNDAVYYREELRELFKRGQIRLRELSLAEDIFLEIVRAIVRELQGVKRIPPGLDGLEQSLSDIYYGNFSVFQSLPDVWAIEQVFPVMPVHRHNEQPTRQAIIADITCDSDGKIDQFIDTRGIRKTLPVHPLVDGQPYYLGVFLVGAYQETLGDLHNLMGDTNVVSVRINADGTLRLRARDERRQHRRRAELRRVPAAAAARAVPPDRRAGGAQGPHHAGASGRRCWKASRRACAATPTTKTEPEGPNACPRY